MEISKISLETLYYSTTNKKAAAQLGVSTVTLSKYIIEYDIKQKGKGFNAGRKPAITLETQSKTK